MKARTSRALRPTAGISPELLRQFSLFRLLTVEQAQQVCQSCLERRFHEDRVIFSQGEPCDYLYLIVSGRVRVSLLNHDGREILLRVYGPNEVVGELAVLDGGVRSAGAVAADDVCAYLLSRETFMGLLRDNFAMVQHVLAMLVERLRYTTAYAENLVFLDAPARIAAILTQLASTEENSQNEPGDEVRVAITQHELAKMAATTREWVNKALNDFARRGFVRVERGVVVVNRSKLQSSVW